MRAAIVLRCVARGKPLPISKDFSPSKSGWFYFFFFFWNFANRNPFLRVFLPQNMADLTVLFCFFPQNFRKSGPLLGFFLPQNGWFCKFFHNFCEMWLSSKDLGIFRAKWDPKDFWWKSNPFVWHIPVCFNNMWATPGCNYRWIRRKNFLSKFFQSHCCAALCGTLQSL